MNYKDGKTLGKIMAKLKEHRKVYMHSYDGTIKVKWGGKWVAYHIVMQMDKDLMIEEE